MCTWSPQIHDCGHDSTSWSYCDNAIMDGTTGTVTPCRASAIGRTINSNEKCPLENCRYRTIPRGGYWACCQCGHYNNTAWCIHRRQESVVLTNPATGAPFTDDHCLHLMCIRCILYGSDNQVIMHGKGRRHDRDGRKDQKRRKWDSKGRGAGGSSVLISLK